MSESKFASLGKEHMMWQQTKETSKKESTTLSGLLTPHLKFPQKRGKMMDAQKMRNNVAPNLQLSFLGLHVRARFAGFYLSLEVLHLCLEVLVEV